MLKRGINLCLIFGLGAIIIVPNVLQKTIIVGMIIGGRFIAPEASKVLQHYCFGNGDTLYLDPNYLRTSPVVQKNLDNMSIGQSKKIRFHQKEDWRLSYALNPFTITKTNHGAIIEQYIKFRENDYTYLNILGYKIKVSDNVVHVFECKPFVAICVI